MNRYSSLPAGFTAITSGIVLKGDIVKAAHRAQYEDAAGCIGRTISAGVVSGGYTVWRLTDESLLPEFTIKNRFDDSVIFTGKGLSLEAVFLLARKNGANLLRADLTGADLTGADLSGADLSGADLSGADLSGADLLRADLSGADLRSADLRSADLTGANLRFADLRGADLLRANLSGANLSGANLLRANLSGADLSGADLSGADLSGADLLRARLDTAQRALVVAQRTIVPEEGDIIGFKKVCVEGGGYGLIKLLIPASAKRVGGVIARKCRAEFAVVLEGSGFSSYDSSFKYVKGETVKPDSFNEDPFLVCEPGIHFFITRAEAEAYSL